MRNLDLSEKIGKGSYQVRQILALFLQISCSNFKLKLALELPKLSNQSSLKGPGAS